MLVVLETGTNLSKKSNSVHDRIFADIAEDLDFDNAEKQPVTKLSNENDKRSSDGKIFHFQLPTNINLIAQTTTATRSLDNFPTSPLQLKGTIRRPAFTTSRFTFGDSCEKDIANNSYISLPAKFEVKVTKPKITNAVASVNMLQLYALRQKPQIILPEILHRSIVKRRYRNSVNLPSNDKSLPKPTRITKAIHNTNFKYPKSKIDVRFIRLREPIPIVTKAVRIGDKASATLVKSLPEVVASTTPKPEITTKITTTALPITQVATTVATPVATSVQQIVQNTLSQYANKCFELYRQVISDLGLPEVPLPAEVYGGQGIVSLAPRPQLVSVRFLQKPKPLLPRLVGVRFLQRPVPIRPRLVGIRILRKPQPNRPRLVGIRFIRKPVPNRPRLVGIRFLERVKPNRPRLVGIRYVDKYKPLLLAGMTPTAVMPSVSSMTHMTPISPVAPVAPVARSVTTVTTQTGGLHKPVKNTIRIVNYKMPFKPHVRAFPYPYRPTVETSTAPPFTNGPFGHGRYQHFRNPYLQQSITSFEASKPIIVRPPAIPKGIENNGKAPIYLVQTKVSAPVFIMPNHGSSLSGSIPSPPILPTPTFSTIQKFFPNSKPQVDTGNVANAVRTATLQGKAAAASASRLPPIPYLRR
uniref:DUF4758 domain-containing protein n=1 Tax=Syphacia muris TaxID=451379 RepID=A0A0N5AAM7_9BILA